METTRYLTKLAEQGDADACFRLGYRLAYGRHVKRANWKKCIELWKVAAQQRHRRAMYNVAICYDLGRGVKKDLKTAFKWYKKSAEEGYPNAQYDLGVFYSKGEVVKQDHKQKAYWYELAALQGDKDAQRDLGYAYFYGEGVLKMKRRRYTGIKNLRPKMIPKLYIIWAFVINMVMV